MIWRFLPAPLAFVFFMGLATTVKGEDWPGWRGPRGDGSSHEKNIPIEWSADENTPPAEWKNIAWRTPLPGIGHSSPVVSGDRIFTNTADSEKQDRVLVSLDRKTGTVQWQKTVVHAPLEKKHKLNSFASSTPATDGKHVYTTFLDQTDMVVAAYDFEGNQKWLVRPGVFSSVHGYCSSPVIFQDLLIVNGDHDGESYVVALERDSGKTRWKINRAKKTRSYSVPLIREVNGKPQMFLAGSYHVSGYDPTDGTLLWFVSTDHLRMQQYVASLVYQHGLIFVTAGFPDRHFLAIRPDGTGDVTKTHIAWQDQKGVSYVPSPIAEGDYFLVVSDDGIASEFEAKTGKRLWQERMGRHFSGSLVSAGGLVYFPDDDGITTVVRPGEKFEVVAKNTLGDASYSSPAISQGQIFIRTEKYLWAIGK